MQGGYKNRDFQTISRYISETIQDTGIVTMECEYEGIHKLSNGTIFNDDIIQRQITRKWYNIELFLQRSIERCHFQRP